MTAAAAVTKLDRRSRRRANRLEPLRGNTAMNCARRFFRFCVLVIVSLCVCLALQAPLAANPAAEQAGSTISLVGQWNFRLDVEIRYNQASK